MIGEKQKQLKRILRSGANLDEGRIGFEPTLEFAQLSADGELEASESGFDFDEIEFWCLNLHYIKCIFGWSGETMLRRITDNNMRIWWLCLLQKESSVKLLNFWKHKNWVKTKPTIIIFEYKVEVLIWYILKL